jgi:hypothetical protein
LSKNRLYGHISSKIWKKKEGDEEESLSEINVENEEEIQHGSDSENRMKNELETQMKNQNFIKRSILGEIKSKFVSNIR